MPGTTLEKMATDGDDKSDDSTRSVIDYKSMEITCIDDEKEQGTNKNEKNLGVLEKIAKKLTL